jgi:hypothetical protein
MQIIADAYPADADAPRRTAEELARDLEIPKLKRASGAGTNTSLEARRRLNELEVQLGFYLPDEASRASAHSRARYYLSSALLINDRSPVTLYLLGATHAQMNARKDALDMLGRAIGAGFRDVALLEIDPAFRRLRSSPEFMALVHRARTTGDSLDVLTVDRPPLPIQAR